MEKELEKLTVKQLSTILRDADVKFKGKKVEIISKIIEHNLQDNASELIALADSKPKKVSSRAKKSSEDESSKDETSTEKKPRAKKTSEDDSSKDETSSEKKKPKPRAKKVSTAEKKKPRARKGSSKKMFNQALKEILVDFWDKDDENGETTRGMFEDLLGNFTETLSPELHEIDSKEFAKYMRDVIVTKLKLNK
jgi:hypothetical protein